MRFAFETVIWGRRIENLELVLDTIAACGYRGVEFAQAPGQIMALGSDEKRVSIEALGIKELLRLLGERDLSLVGLAGGTLEQRIRFCGDFRDCFLYVEDLGEAEWKALMPPQSKGDPLPFKLALHPHWFMKVQRMDQARNLLAAYRKKFPAGRDLLLLPDTAHLTLVDEPPDKMIEDNYADLAAIHLKDWDPAYGRYSHRYSQGFVSLGKGRVRLLDTLNKLRKLNYAGWVIVEQDLADPSPAKSVLECSEWLHEHEFMPGLDRVRISTALTQEQIWAESTHGKVLATSNRTREGVILERLIPATVRGPEAFYQAAVEAICDLFNLAAVKIYSYYPLNLTFWR